MMTISRPWRNTQQTSGKVSFFGARVADGQVSFYEAQFSGSGIIFDRAQVSGGQAQGTRAAARTDG